MAETGTSSGAADSDYSFDRPLILNDSKLAAKQPITTKQGILYKKPNNPALYWRVLDKEYDLANPDVCVDQVALLPGSVAVPSLSFKHAADTGFYLSDDQRSLAVSVAGQGIGRFSADGLHITRLSLGHGGTTVELRVSEDGRTVLVGGRRAVWCEEIDPQELRPAFVLGSGSAKSFVAQLAVQCFADLWVMANNATDDSPTYPSLCAVINGPDGQPAYYGRPFVDRDIHRILALAYHDEQIIVVYEGAEHALCVRTFDQCGDECVPQERPVTLGVRNNDMPSCEIICGAHLAVICASQCYARLDNKWMTVGSEDIGEIRDGRVFAAWKCGTRTLGRGHLVSIKGLATNDISDVRDGLGNHLGHAVDGVIRLF